LVHRDFVLVELHTVHDDMGPVEVGRTLGSDDVEHFRVPLLLASRQDQELRRSEVRRGASLIDLNKWPHPGTQGEVRRRAFHTDAPAMAFQ
jgi:hypothetical protein